MLNWSIYLLSLVPLISLGSAGVEYEVQKTLIRISQANSIDRGLQILSARFIQSGANLSTSINTISDSQDPVDTISMGFVQAGDLDGSACQKQEDDSCYFNQDLLNDSQTETGNLVMQVSFKNSADIPASLRSKKVLFFAHNYHISSDRIKKTTNNLVDQASITNFTCSNPATSLNNNLPLGSIGLQNESDSSQATNINILNRSTNAIKLCAVN